MHARPEPPPDEAQPRNARVCGFRHRSLNIESKDALRRASAHFGYRIVFEEIFRGSDFKFQTLDTTLRIELESYRENDVRQCFSGKFSSAWLMRYCNTKRKFDSAPGFKKAV